MAMRLSWIAAFALFCGARQVNGAVVDLTFGSPYTQNFNLLGSSGGPFDKTTGPNPLPTGWDFVENPLDTTYAVGTGSSATGDTYSFGAAGNSDRALGSLLSGSVQSIIGFAFRNTSGQTIDSLDIAFRGEQWRLGDVTPQRFDSLDFSYSTNASSLTVGTYTNFSSLSYASTTTTGSVGALNGNAIFSPISATLTNLNLADNQVLWMRWTDANATGSDDGLAIDDFSMTANFTVVPEPSTLTIYGVLSATTFVGAAWRRRRAKRAALQPASS